MIFDRHANLKYKYGNRHFWCRGYYVDTVGKYEGAIKEYIRNQLQEQHFTTFTLPRKLMKLVYTRPELSPLDFLRFGP